VSRLIIALDSLKFYKLKNENTARILFLIVYILFLGFYAFPIGKPLDIDQITKILQGVAIADFSAIISGNLVFLASQLFLYILTSFFALVYANCYVMQSEGFPSKKAVLSSIRGLPKLIGFMILMLVPVALSSFFAFIPLIFLFYALFFVPMLITEGKRGIIEAIVESFKSTKGVRFNIFITQMMVYFIMNIPITLFGSAFLYTGNSNTIAEFLVLSFLRAAYVLMGGRLIGNFYLMVIKNEEKIRKVNVDVSESNSDSEDNQDEESEDKKEDGDNNSVS